MTTSDQSRPRRGRTPAVFLSLCLLLVVALAGCGDLLDVELPGEIEESSLDNPDNAEALVTSLVGGFECTFTNYVLLSGNVGDELLVAGSFAVFFPYDQRSLEEDANAGGYPGASCASEGGLYEPINQTRWMGDETIARLEGFTDEQVPNRTFLLAKAHAYTGFTYALFGQSWCQYVVDEGPGQSPAEALATAESHFDEAIALAESAGATDIAHMAYGGRARVRLLLENYSGAIADAGEVPEDYVRYATRSEVSSLRENKIFDLNRRQGRTVPEPRFWNLEWKGVDDPRVDVEDTGERGNDALTPLWHQNKYTSFADPVPIVSHAEMQLVVAEASARTGEEGTAVDIINDLHDDADLPEYDPSTDGPVLEHLIEERARQLFLEGHRHYDMLRFDLDFPEGSHPWTGRNYRNTTCFPVPEVERNNNPNFSS